ncbi:MAG: MarR family winged helix-turn-helix transcriptional regulator [Pseudomonadota bacterium]|nr:MarR family winged helix-turn-helix transcriptional regulator [Pseudomonadota bacterium]
MSDRQTDRDTPLCPKGRLSDPVKLNEGHRVVSLDTFIPGLLSRIDNALSRGASQVFRRDFGIGMVEWRVMAMLAIEPRIHAVRVCEVTSCDKGQVSRALASLHDQGIVTGEVVGADPRKKKWWLTDKGYAIHDQLFAVALAREERLIEGCDTDDLEAFLRVARIMEKNVAKL